MSSLHFGQNVEVTLEAGGCDQYVGPVGVVSVWWIHFLPHDEVLLLLLCLCILASSSLLSVQFL